MAEDVLTKFSKRFELGSEETLTAIAVPLPQAERLKLIRGSKQRRRNKAKREARAAAVEAFERGDADHERSEQMRDAIED